MGLFDWIDPSWTPDPNPRAAASPGLGFPAWVDPTWTPDPSVQAEPQNPDALADAWRAIRQRSAPSLPQTAPDPATQPAVPPGSGPLARFPVGDPARRVGSPEWSQALGRTAQAPGDMPDFSDMMSGSKS